MRGQGKTAAGQTVLYGETSVTLLAPIPRPPGIACFITWPTHIEDSRAKGYTMLNFPSKDGDMRAYYKANPDSVAGTGTTVPMPSYASEMDVECETD